MKRPIGWHRGVIEQATATIEMVEKTNERLRYRLTNNEANVKSLKEKVLFLEHQIVEAEKRGKREFDAKTFCHPKKRTVPTSGR